MKNLVYFILLIAFAFYSCRKTEDVVPVNPPSTAVAVSNNYPLSLGSYWIYERFNMDTNGVETTLYIDSTYISGDSIIHGDTFSVIVGDIFGPTDINVRRDSSRYLVDQFGTIFCSNTNFTDTLLSGSVPGHADFYYKMMPATTIVVPAGSFAACDYLGTVNITMVGYPWDTSRNIHFYYADNVGLIRETTYFFSSPNYIGRKLLRYHIE